MLMSKQYRQNFEKASITPKEFHTLYKAKNTARHKNVIGSIKCARYKKTLFR